MLNKIKKKKNILIYKCKSFTKKYEFKKNSYFEKFRSKTRLYATFVTGVFVVLEF